MKKLNIQWFIEQEDNWEQKLAEKPYCIQISRDKMFGHNLIMFKYSQIESDFNIGLVRECRGLILDEDTHEVVCHSFNKFGNYGESYCPEIDWKSCYVTEKLDGSLIKIVRLGDDFLISTNGTIDAYKAPIAEQIGCLAKSFGDLVWFALLSNYQKANNLTMSDCIDPSVVKGWMKKIFQEGYTYMFELTSPWNKVVVQWNKLELHFIGCRNHKDFGPNDNIPGKEIFFGDHELSKIFHTPQVFPLHSVDECIAAAEKLDCNAEGYVVVDKNFNRVKIKSPTYVALHHMKNNGILSYERGIDIVRGNELGEVLTYFPEFKDHLEKIKEDYDKYIAQFEVAEKQLNEWIVANGYDKQPWWIESGGQKRKDLAMFVMSKMKKYSAFAFAYADHKTTSAKEWLTNMPSKNLVVALGYKD